MLRRRCGALLAGLAGLASGSAMAQPAEQPPAVLAIILDDRLLTGPGGDGVILPVRQALPFSRRILLCSWQSGDCRRGSPLRDGRMPKDLESALEGLQRRASEMPPKLDLFDDVVDVANRGFDEYREEISRNGIQPSPDDLRYHL